MINDGRICRNEEFFPEITDRGVQDMYQLLEIVYNTHYSYVRDEYLIEDMRGSALVKMIEFVKSGTFDPTRGSLKNCLYTCCRNEMKNVIYRHSKDSPVDDEVMAINEAPAITVSLSSITFNDVNLVRCKEIDKVKSNLNHMGFIVEGFDGNEYDEDYDRWTALAIWKRLR